MKQDLKDASDRAGATGPPAGEMDPITATIEAVLANAASFDTSVEKLKKMKRTKKCQETPKQDGSKSAEDEDNDDGSTAGNSRFYLLSRNFMSFNANYFFFSLSQTGETKGRRVATEEQVQFPLQHG